MLKILFSLQTAIMVFEKPTTIRRPLLYATNMRDGRTRRDVASAPSPMKPYNPLFIWSLEKHPSFSFAVGMPVAWHPPHRSQRAILSHWAPALSHHAKTLFWVRMIEAGRREPPFHPPHPTR